MGRLIPLIVVSLLASQALAKPPKVEDLVAKIDNLYRADSSEAEIIMTITTPDWERTMKLKAWSRGRDEMLIRILSPKKDAGVATLRRKNEMWNYFPKINKVIKVPPSMMMSSWMGSDFTNDDLVRETSLLNDYNATLTEQGSQYHLVLTPKQMTATVWGKIEIAVDRRMLVPINQIFYNEKGEKVRTMAFKEVKIFDGRNVPSVMLLTPLNKSGHKTTLTYSRLKFNTSASDDLFSLRSLQSRM